jgi:hypothetical protein
VKVAITGHTDGLGAQFYKHFKSLGHDVIGMSRTNGYCLPDDVGRVVEIANGSDLFINNAYCDTAQSQLLELTKAPVISCGSMGADFNQANPYFRNKRHLEDTHRRLKRTTDRRMLLLKMGYLENYADKFPVMYSEIISAVDFWLLSDRVSMIEFENHRIIYGA